MGFFSRLFRRLFWPNDPELLGRDGELHVANLLSRLDGTRYFVHNDVMIPTFYGTTQIDHIVFSQYGIFVIETKNYKGWIFGSFNGESWQQTLYKEKHFFRNPHLQNIGHIKALRRLLINPRQDLFVPIVVFTGDAVLKLHSDIRQYVLYEDELVDKIRSFRETVMSESAALRFSKLLVRKEIVGEKRTTEHIRYAESVEAKSQIG